MNRQEKQEVENSLRNLLEEMSMSDKNLEYYSCIELINKITRIFKQLKQNNQEYKKLEQVLQQQEAEIRNHISLEQQMKLYQDGLQQKLDEANQEIKKLQNDIHKLKKIKFVNHNVKIKVMMDQQVIVVNHHLKNNYHYHNMVVIHHIVVLVMNYLKDIINYYNNNKHQQVKDQIIYKQVNL